jgi:phosphatidylglycerol:prolipoprotein diacylglycerol transferase
MDPELAQVGPLHLWYYGLAYAIGLLAIHLRVYLRRERLGYDRRDVALFSLSGGVLLGGRLCDVALYEWFYYGEHPWQILRPSEGGMATHGVLIGAVVGTAIFCRLRNKSFLDVADEVVVPGAVLLALGRVGNHINGEVYGSVTSVPWSVRFPYGEGRRHPVALYDGAKNLLLVPILLVVLCLTIPSGWTQQVLQDFEARAGESSPGVGCGGSREEEGIWA